MGKKEKQVKRVVLDTNVLISALLFRGGLSKIVGLWQKGKIIPVISKETFRELLTVLEYPKFSLTQEEIDPIIKYEILPYFEIVEVVKDVKRISGDPEDDKFISCAISGSADYIVSGDKDLFDLKQYKSIKIIKASDFLKMYNDF
ncbi:MAG: putative toxin-antitoxin system toxin component, PIN family [Syntrophales bacterium]